MDCLPYWATVKLRIPGNIIKLQWKYHLSLKILLFILVSYKNLWAAFFSCEYLFIMNSISCLEKKGHQGLCFHREQLMGKTNTSFFERVSRHKLTRVQLQVMHRCEWGWGVGASYYLCVRVATERTPEWVALFLLLVGRNQGNSGANEKCLWMGKDPALRSSGNTAEWLHLHHRGVCLCCWYWLTATLWFSLLSIWWTTVKIFFFIDNIFLFDSKSKVSCLLINIIFSYT